MSRKKKRKLSDYNKFVKQYFKDNPGATLSEAAESWRTGPGFKGLSGRYASKRPSNPGHGTLRRRRKTPRKKKKSRSKGLRLPGGIGPKGLISGIIGMAVIPRLVPVTSPGAQKLATGLALRALKIGGGGALSAVGLMELGAQFIVPAIGGAAGSFGFGAGGATNGGFDY